MAVGKRVAVGADHAGYQIKDEVVKYLEEQGYQVKDFGTFTSASVDYPDIGIEVSRQVAAGAYDCGILICGTGLGMALTANKVKGIRAVTCHDTFSARYSRLHNNANILTLGARVVGLGLALEVIDVWLTTEFAGGRHERRVAKFMALEDSDAD